MSAFLKKRFTKWSMISILGITAYFLGFSFGADELNDQIIAQFEAEKLEKAAMPDTPTYGERQQLAQNARPYLAQNARPYLAQNARPYLARNDHAHAHNTLIFLPGSQQAADLSQLK